MNDTHYGTWKTNVPPKSKETEVPYIVNPYEARDPASFGFTDIVYVKERRIATIVINRPHVHNTYRIETLREMKRALDDALVDRDIGVIVLTGAGERAFCTGGDVKQYYDYFGHRTDDGRYPNAKDYRLYLLKEFGAVTLGLVTSFKPTIARLNGIAVGGGNEMNMACDFHIAADDTYIAQVGNQVGSIAAGGATQWLRLFIGDARARDMLLRTLDAKVNTPKAAEWGLINVAVPRDQLDEMVLKYATDLLNRYPDGTAMHKALMPDKAVAWAQTYAAAMEMLTQNFQIPEGPADIGFQAFARGMGVDFEAYRGGAPLEQILVERKKK